MDALDALFASDEQPVSAETAEARATLEAEEAAQAPATKKRKRSSGAATTTTPEERVAPPPLLTYKRTLGGQQRPDGQQFRATFANAGQLGTLLSKLRALIPSVRLEFGPADGGGRGIDGFRIQALNEARTTFVQLSVPRCSFIVYEGQPETPANSLHCYTSFFFNERRAFKDTHTLTLSRFINGNPDQPLGVHVHPAFARNAKARVTAAHIASIDGEAEAFPEIDTRELHQYLVLMRTKVLQDIVVQSKDRFSELAFGLTDERLQVVGRAEGAEGGVTVFGVSYDAGTYVDSLALRAEDAIGSFEAPRDDPGAIGDAERIAFDSIDAQLSDGVELCRLERLPFAPRDVARAQLDNVRISVKYLAEAMTLAHASDYVELRFGRVLSDRESLSPVRLRFRVLDDARRRALVTTTLYIAPLLDDKV